MRTRAQRGQSMVELAIGVAIFLLATLGAVQLGLLALAEQGVQSATLAGARVASGSPASPDPILSLQQGALAVRAALAAPVAGMASAALCRSSGSSCWTALECVRYRSGVPEPGTQEPCAAVRSDAGGLYSYGPVPTDLDGPQNPRCRHTDCFGVAATMAPCAAAAAPGRLSICVAFTSWPPRAVDVWVSGGLRLIVPWVGSAGPATIPVASRLRLAVETFS
ncbi:MAG: TadE family protein [Candidatus Dormibacteria bacterium]